MIDFPNGKYKIIYADPPWKYNDSADAGARGASHKYNVMTFNDLLLLPVNNLAAKNSLCFMWVTAPFMAEGLALLKAWGFEYKTIGFTWVKTLKHDKREFADDYIFRLGMGHYTRANAEFVLIGKKGATLTRKAKNINSVIAEPIRAHSQKPAAVRERIDQLYGRVKKIELFAREKVPGWDAWGDQIAQNKEV